MAKVRSWAASSEDDPQLAASGSSSYRHAERPARFGELSHPARGATLVIRSVPALGTDERGQSIGSDWAPRALPLRAEAPKVGRGF